MPVRPVTLALSFAVVLGLAALATADDPAPPTDPPADTKAPAADARPTDAIPPASDAQNKTDVKTPRTERATFGGGCLLAPGRGRELLVRIR